LFASFRVRESSRLRGDERSWSRAGVDVVIMCVRGAVASRLRVEAESPSGGDVGGPRRVRTPWLESSSSSLFPSGGGGNGGRKGRTRDRHSGWRVRQRSHLLREAGRRRARRSHRDGCTVVGWLVSVSFPSGGGATAGLKVAPREAWWFVSFGRRSARWSNLLRCLSWQQDAACVSDFLVRTFDAGAGCDADIGSPRFAKGAQDQAHRRFLRATGFDQAEFSRPCLQGWGSTAEAGQEVRAAGQPVVCGGASGQE
jgi:hypothetical protein